jgi:hypothetical protein
MYGETTRARTPAARVAIASAFAVSYEKKSD